MESIYAIVNFNFIYLFLSQAVVINQIILRESLMELMIWLNGLTKTTLHIMLLMFLEE